MFIAPPAYRLVEVDFNSIEAVLTGWFANDPDYIRIAKLSVHAVLASYIIPLLSTGR